MKRFLLMIISALLSGVVFTSCEKIDYKTMECQQITSGLAKLGGDVIVRFFLYSLIVGDSPNGVQLNRYCAKLLPSYLQADRKRRKKHKKDDTTFVFKQK